MTPVEKLLRDLSAAANVTVDPAFYQRLGEQGVETFVQFQQLPRLLLALFLAGDHGFPLWPSTIRFRIHFFFFFLSPMSLMLKCLGEAHQQPAAPAKPVSPAHPLQRGLPICSARQSLFLFFPSLLNAHAKSAWVRNNNDRLPSK